MKVNVFTVVTELTKSYSPTQIDYLRMYQSVPKELKSGKTSLQIVDESIDQLQDVGSNLEAYRQSLNAILKLLDFYLFVCREHPELERPCCDDVGWLKLHYKTIERTVGYVNELLVKNYDKKTLTKKLQNIQNMHSEILNSVKEVRVILSKQTMGEVTEDLSSQEQQLHEPLAPEAYQPNNPVSN